MGGKDIVWTLDYTDGQTDKQTNARPQMGHKDMVWTLDYMDDGQMDGQTGDRQKVHANKLSYLSEDF